MADLFTTGTKTVRQKVTSVLIHLLAIFILLILPEVVMNLAETTHKSIPTGVYVKTVLCIIVFYVNYFFLFDYCIKRPNFVVRFLGLNLLLFILVMSLNYVTWTITADHLPIHEEAFPAHHSDYHPGPPLHGDERPPMGPKSHAPGTFGFLVMVATRLMRDAIILVLSIGLSVAVKFSMRWVKTERLNQEQRTAQRESELRELRNQINPHFLFNALNTIYALIDICPNRAKQSVHTLGAMMRYLLYENSGEVPVSHEIKFVESYIELMKLRLGDRTPLKVNIDATDSTDLKIAPVMFMTVIENVFKHGITGDPSREIRISIKVEGCVVRCETFNYYIAKQDAKQSGIGLENLRRRLELLYGNNAQLNIASTEETYTVNMIITLNTNQNK